MTPAPRDLLPLISTAPTLTRTPPPNIHKHFEKIILVAPDWYQTGSCHTDHHSVLVAVGQLEVTSDIAVANQVSTVALATCMSPVRQM